MATIPAGLPLRDRMMRWMRAAAAYLASDPERAKGAVIGGEIELTTITASEVSVRPIGFMPVDQADDTVPAASGAVSAPGMSRAEHCRQEQAVRAA